MPEYPYAKIKSTSEALLEETLKYLDALGVVFFLDQDHSEAVIIPGNEELLEGGDVLLYKSVGSLLKPSKKRIDLIREPEDLSEKAVLKKRVASQGDNAYWLMWNKQFTVSEITSQGVVTK